MESLSRSFTREFWGRNLLLFSVLQPTPPLRCCYHFPITWFGGTANYSLLCLGSRRGTQSWSVNHRTPFSSQEGTFDPSWTHQDPSLGLFFLSFFLAFWIWRRSWLAFRWESKKDMNWGWLVGIFFTIWGRYLQKKREGRQHREHVSTKWWGREWERGSWGPCS